MRDYGAYSADMKGYEGDRYPAQEEEVYHPMSKEWRSSTQAAAAMGYDRLDFDTLESVPEHRAILARFQDSQGRAIYCGFSRAWNCYIFRWVRKED